MKWVYRAYLLEERGIAVTSTVSYVHVARLFLNEHSDSSECTSRD